MLAKQTNEEADAESYAARLPPTMQSGKDTEKDGDEAENDGADLNEPAYVDGKALEAVRRLGGRGGLVGRKRSL